MDARTEDGKTKKYDAELLRKIVFPKPKTVKYDSRRNTNMKTSLVVMAAGMGSRYGGLKQIDKIDPIRSKFGEIEKEEINIDVIKSL